MSVILNNNTAYEVVWGGDSFNPSALVLQASSAQAGSSLGFSNKLDLNGAYRIVAMNGTALGVVATISGVIRNSSGIAAGLIKSGPGLLILTAANTYNGGSSINEGTLRFADKNTMPASGNVTVNDGTPLSIGVGTGNLWITGTSGNATIASATLDVGYRTTAGSLRYTGSGHTSDCVINLAGTTGGTTLDASGSDAWVLTSAMTATGAGAKTLTLTGTSTAGNSIPTTALPGLAEVLMVQKSGVGTWRVGGFTSPKNAWSVTAGTLVVTGAIVTGDQLVTVSGGTLAGTGPIQHGRHRLRLVPGQLGPSEPAFRLPL